VRGRPRPATQAQPRHSPALRRRLPAGAASWHQRPPTETHAPTHAQTHAPAQPCPTPALGAGSLARRPHLWPLRATPHCFVRPELCTCGALDPESRAHAISAARRPFAPSAAAPARPSRLAARAHGARSPGHVRGPPQAGFCTRVCVLASPLPTPPPLCVCDQPPAFESKHGRGPPAAYATAIPRGCAPIEARMAPPRRGQPTRPSMQHVPAATNSPAMAKHEAPSARHPGRARSHPAPTRAAPRRGAPPLAPAAPGAARAGQHCRFSPLPREELVLRETRAWNAARPGGRGRARAARRSAARAPPLPAPAAAAARP
jgi:hypothetical protein